ncbi:hypothetical protein LJC54_01935 [Parabacteroides sp. OttesenSCG-928-J18]|nr:hypothetical protein [Parabacteroides sp. OttesenSCG-928-J18]
MKTYLYIIFLLFLVLISCGKNKTDSQQQETLLTDTVSQVIASAKKEAAETIENQSDTESLNDIRFGDWKEADWHNNDYFRFLRKCFDDCYIGIDNEVTESLKKLNLPLKSKFVILNAEPYLLGGMFITFVFLEDTETVYNTAVYSVVDEERRIVVEYNFSGLQKLEEKFDLSKEDILKTIEENPILQLW